MKVYNTLKKKKVELIPQEENKIKMYVCGPTLYGDIHIGNTRPIIFYDVVYRYLDAIGWDVKYVSNITDIDDKIINKAIELNITEQELVQENIKRFNEVLEDLNVKEIYKRPTVVEYMDNIIKFIEKLIDKGYAYKTEDGDVYFRVNKIEDYGHVANRNTEELVVGIRVGVNENKENGNDFALWKNTSNGIVWKAPFGEGRPGWHTECTVMVKDIFDGKVDIHGGGMDLKFPHHENENAQFEALYGEDIANYWLHNGFINIDGEKMSKSLGNFITARDFIDQYDGNTIRLLLLQTNYRQPLNLTEEFINQTTKLLNKIEDYSWNITNEQVQMYLEEPINESIKEIMDDDFNTPNLVSLLLESIKKDDKKIYAQIIYILGLKFDYSLVEAELEEEILIEYTNYKMARENKDFEVADSVKKELIDLGYEITVRRDGIKIKRKR